MDKKNIDIILERFGEIGLNYPIKIPIEINGEEEIIKDYAIIEDNDDLYALALTMKDDLLIDYTFKTKNYKTIDKGDIMKARFHVLDLRYV